MKKDIIHTYLSVKVLPIWAILMFDIVTVILSVFVAYILRLGLNNIAGDISDIERSLLVILVVNFIFFRIFRTYSGVLRYSSFIDVMRIFVALTLGYGIVALGNVIYFLYSQYHFPESPKFVPDSVLFMAYVLNLTLMACSRIVTKVIYDSVSFDGSRSVNVFIYGAYEAGINIAKSLRINLKDHYRLKGFIVDNPELVNKVMMGVKVYANDDNLMTILIDKGVKTVIISPLKMKQLIGSELLNTLLDNQIKLLTVPPISEWNNRTLDRTQLKEMQIEDLLQRETIKVDIKKIATHLEGKCVMITGAAGSIGSEIMRQVASFNPYKLILVDQAETPLHNIRLELQDSWRNLDAETVIADISCPDRMEKLFQKYSPQYIFHAAAYKHVPMMEDNVSESIRVNVLGTKTMADLSVKYHAEKFVMISTDKAVNPTNVMGCSKRLAEIYVQSLAKKLEKDGEHSLSIVTTRFGNVLGSNGSVIPRFKEQIQKGGPVTVTHPDIIRYFMTIPEACRLVLEAGCSGQSGDIYIFDMGEPVKIIDLAKQMISLSGNTSVKIEITGLRHGEKLYEELLNVKEHTHPTHHEKIMIASVREYNYDQVNARINELIAKSYTSDQMEIVAIMKKIVPEFISKNSCFEVLDK